MTDATARRESKRANDDGHCGFCGSRSTQRFAVAGQRVVHLRSCKLVCEHGGRIPLLSEPEGET